MIKLDSIKKSFGDKTVLNELSFEFKDKTLYILTGENGSGKSCLLYILAFLDKDYGGEMFINNKSMYFATSKDIERQRQRVSLLLPKGNLVSFLNCYDNLTLGVVDKSRVINLIPSLDLKQNVQSLSGGEEILLALSREISLDKDYYLMDEITDALDDVHFKQVMDALCKLANEKLVILATHDKRTLSYGTRLILKEGKLFQE